MSTPNGSSHENTDAKPMPLVWFGVGMVVFIAASAAVGLWVLRALESVSVDHPGPGAVSQAAPAEPRLQVSEWSDLKALRGEAERTLRTYDWADSSKGAVRIPIERAMDIVIQKKLIKSKASR